MNQEPESERLFFALWPDERVRAALAATVRSVVPPAARAVAVENLHLTLVFLGAVEPSRRACLEQVADGIRQPTFELCLDRLGHFQRSRVCWLGSSQPLPAALLDLVSDLQAAQVRCGMEPEQRPFRAHLTLARKVRRRPRSAPPPALHWPVERFALVRSQTFADGPVYQLQRSWTLQPR